MSFLGCSLRDIIELRFHEGFEEGILEARETVCKKSLTHNIPIEVIHEITGLDLETIQEISFTQN